MLRNRVIDAIKEAVSTLGDIKSLPELKVEYARDEKFGDYACTIAMDKCWRESFQKIDPSFANPRNFASAIKDILLQNKKLSRLFTGIDIAGPGFINFTLAPDIIYEYVRDACLLQDKYGRTSSDTARKTIFEFVSANPTGPLNIVSARAAALGDSCCNLLEAAGEKVYREYYVNDAGNQIDLLGQSCFLRYLEFEGISIKFCEKAKTGEVIFPHKPGLPFPPEGYHGDYIKDITVNIIEANPGLKLNLLWIAALDDISKETDVSLEFLNEGDLPVYVNKFSTAATVFFVESHRKDLEKFRVKFDNFFHESKLHQDNGVLHVRKFLKKHLYQEENKEYFKSTDFGDDKDRVVIRTDGRPTYLLADIAYHFSKIRRGFAEIIDIWGPDHHGYIDRLTGAMQALGFPSDRFRVLIAQQVNMLEDGKQIVMSKRTGKFITLQTLTDEIPVDVARYFFVMRSFESHLDFDLTEASDTSEKNPYYYVAYAHARIRSIFRKASEKSMQPLKSDHWGPEYLNKVELAKERRRLLWLVARYPEEIHDAAASLEPHRMINYLYQLATALSRFYGPRENRIIDQDAATAAVLLSILEAVAVCLKNGLKLLGMVAPDRLIREEPADLPESKICE